MCRTFPVFRPKLIPDYNLKTESSSLFSTLTPTPRDEVDSLVWVYDLRYWPDGS